MANIAATLPATSAANPDRAGARQLLALLAELCLRGIGISVAIAAVIFIYLVIVGGLNG